MEKHVPDLEYCKKLKEAGWKKEGRFKWVDWTGSTGAVLSYKPPLGDYAFGYWYPAPILTELLRELLDCPDNETYLSVNIYPKNCKIGYRVVEGFVKSFEDPNPCNAAADLWCWMQEHDEP
jgi:hypothetical protein